MDCQFTMLINISYDIAYNNCNSCGKPNNEKNCLDCFLFFPKSKHLPLVIKFFWLIKLYTNPSTDTKVLSYVETH